jgi:hypothetical protein
MMDISIYIYWIVYFLGLFRKVLDSCYLPEGKRGRVVSALLQFIQFIKVHGEKTAKKSASA